MAASFRKANRAERGASVRNPFRHADFLETPATDVAALGHPFREADRVAARRGRHGMDSGSGRHRCARHPVRNDAGVPAMQSPWRAASRSAIPRLTKASLEGIDDVAGAAESMTGRRGMGGSGGGPGACRHGRVIPEDEPRGARSVCPESIPPCRPFRDACHGRRGTRAFLPCGRSCRGRRGRHGMDSGSGRRRCAPHPVRNDAGVPAAMQSPWRAATRSATPSLTKASLEGTDDVAGAAEPMTGRSAFPGVGNLFFTVLSAAVSAGRSLRRAGLQTEQNMNMMMP
jgi:hypothetical protein